MSLLRNRPLLTVNIIFVLSVLFCVVRIYLYLSTQVISVDQHTSSNDVQQRMRIQEKKNKNEFPSIPKVLLGITNIFPAVSKYERRRRHLIRNSYLQYYNSKRSAKNRICSLQEYQQKNNHDEHETCQLVYTFVVGKNKQTMSIREQDVLVLDRTSSRNKDMSIPWFQYATSLSTTRTDNFDFVAKVTSQHVIFPDDFLSETTRLFFDNDDNSRVLVHSENCQQYSMLSSALASFVFSNYQGNSTNDQDSAESRMKKVTDSHPLGIQLMEPKGVSAEALDKSVYDFLTIWDQYEISKIQYDNTQEVALVQASKAKVVSFEEGNMPRILFGIFTTNNAIERQRREAIRETYLRYYSSKLDNKYPHRICSLTDIVQNKINEQACQLCYVFVIGGNETGPTELVEFNSSHPMTVNPPLESNETDVVYLNIRENMIEGKSQTWFKYAVTVLDSHYFDYIGKIDTDTVLFPGQFLRFGLSAFPTFPNNTRVYGGRYVQPDVRFPFPAFMHGELYLLSPDLARFIVSPLCNRSALMFPSECIAISNFVHSHPLPIQRWRIASRFYAHPVKNVSRFREIYQKATMSNSTT